MIGLGTLINISAIIIGGIVGLVFGRGLNSKIQESITKAIGVSILFIGINGFIKKIGNINSNVDMMIIVCFIIGTMLGEFFDFDSRITEIGAWLKIKTKSTGDPRFIEGFLITSLTVSIGAMAIVGAIEDGIYGNHTILIAKSVLDFAIVLIMTTTYGKGCIFSAIPVFVFQGGITLLAMFVQPFLSLPAMNDLSIVGSILIFAVGINMVWNMKIKVANMLPTIIIAIIWGNIFF